MIDTYLSEPEAHSVFKEPKYSEQFNHDLNAFLKWDKLGKAGDQCPQFEKCLSSHKAALGMAFGGQLSLEDQLSLILKGT